MQIRTTSGGKTVEGSGVVVLTSPVNYLTIHVEDLSFNLHFIAGSEAPKVDARANGSKSVDYTFTNFNSPLGVSYVAPHAATVSGRRITLAFFVHGTGEGGPSYSVAYTVYSE